MALYTKAELSKKSVGDLRKLLDAHGYEAEGVAKADALEALLGLTEEDALVDEEEVEEEAELDEEEAVEEELDDEEDELDTEELGEELPPEEVDEVAPPKKTRTRKPKVEAEEDDEAPAKKPRAPRKTSDAGEDTLAAKQVASILGTEAKTLRQFLRSNASTFEAVGSGGRYEFTEADVPNIQKEFDAWKAGHASRGAGKKSSTPSKPVETIEHEELDLDEELEDEELELEEED